MERRSLKRIQYPGAKVRIRKLMGLGVFNLLSQPKDIIDISKGGASFQVSDQVTKGEPVQIRLIFPDGKSFDLKGQIRWVNVDENRSDVRIGLQFKPFGNSRKYNPLKALEYFRTMEGQQTEFRVNEESEEE